MSLDEMLRKVLSGEITLSEPEAIVFQKWKKYNEELQKMSDKHDQLIKETQKIVVSFQNKQGGALALAELLYDLYSQRVNLIDLELDDLLKE